MAGNRLVPLLALLCVLAIAGLVLRTTAEAGSPDARDGAAMPPTVPVSDAPQEGVQAKPYQVFLPGVYDYVLLNDRMGFGAVHYPIDRYPEIASLRAGWYLDWATRADPPRPNGMEYVQTVRMHQKLACPLSSPNAWNRELCPYEDGYVLRTAEADIVAAAQTNPGSVWLVGNEMDRRDWRECLDWPTCQNVRTGGQDEMLPETYAQAYHDVYALIKGADPTAQVAIGGIIQATPLRLTYLTRIWDGYRQQYGTDMPVDVWNVHNFILREEANKYGADIPPGLSAQSGAHTATDWAHIDRTIFDRQIRDFRAWMVERGQQNKPLIVTEYGMLWYHCVAYGWQNGSYTCVKDLGDRETAHGFMVWTWDYFLNARDCSLGYPQDDCRLVQRWAWFSADHVGADQQGNLSYGFNPHTSLFNATTLEMMKAGELFRDFSLQHR